MTSDITGVVLMTFGSAITADDVPRYLTSVRRGNPPDAASVDEFKRRYDLVGRSPLVDITVAQAAALQLMLDARHGAGSHAVEAGMLHSAPGIATAVERCAARGATSITGIIMSPQYSPVIMAGYNRAISAAAESVGISVVVAGAWHRETNYIASQVAAVSDALDGMPPSVRDAIPVVFTAHSLPLSVVERDQNYIAQLRETVSAVATAASLPSQRVHFAYQSAGHTQEEWLTPDFKDLMPGFRDAGHHHLLLVPTQFVADHLEVLYDIDIAGAEEARQCGLTFSRTRIANTDPSFIGALASVVSRSAPVAAP